MKKLDFATDFATKIQTGALDLAAMATATSMKPRVSFELMCWMTTTNGSLMAAPYTFELNDSVIYPVERQQTGALLDRLRQRWRLFAGSAGITNRAC